MDKVYFEKLLSTAKAANESWRAFEQMVNDPKSIGRFKMLFHLRPTAENITIVSTLDIKPMRGIHCAKTKLVDKLKELHDLTMNEKLSADKLTELGFQDKQKKPDEVAEERYQVQMIRDMNSNQSLKEYLKVSNLTFIASEFIIHGGKDKTPRKRIDIVAYDGNNTLIFFELKTPHNTKDDPKTQVDEYISRYGKNGTYETETKRLLAEYPINAIKESFEIKGYAVYGYSDIVDKDNSSANIIRFK